MTNLNVHIRTFGCQMNAYDSDRIGGLLESLGYRRTSTEQDADLIILNTCTIRDKAEQKVFSFLGRLGEIKTQRPNLIIAVGGCVAQQEGRAILRRAPYVDLVFGTHAVGRLPRLIEKVRRLGRPVVDVTLADGLPDDRWLADRADSGRVSRFVTVMQGCDNFCAYCVVPYVRGREASRPPQAIISEIQSLVASGAREVVLLGQNVNSYGQKEGMCSFAELLARVNEVAGLERIRFTTSHPKDLSADLINAFRDLGKLCPHIHLPVQSGANAILSRMNRRYTREQYTDLIHRLREICPSIAVSSDLIVGFPGETDADFEQTLELIQTVAFDSLFAFVYSDRPQTPARHFADKVPPAIKRLRLQQLIDRQARITRQRHEALVGSTQVVLVEGVNGAAPAGRPQWIGRTGCNKIVHIPRALQFTQPDQDLRGKLVQVQIRQGLAHCLQAQIVPGKPTFQPAKGVCHAAQGHRGRFGHGPGFQHAHHFVES